MKPLIIGIDIGGTHVRVGALDRQGKLLAVEQAEIQAERGFEVGLETLTQLIEKVSRVAPRLRLAGIGIGCSGPVDPIQGEINNPFTLPTWENVPIVARLKAYFGVPVVLENDGDAAALGEYWRGAGQEINRLYALTVGTGVGAAYILDGQIHRGAGGFHPEGGHMVVDPSGPLCYCGMYGCLESLVSGPAIARRMAELRGQRVIGLAASTKPLSEAHQIAEAARQGDPFAVQIMKQTAHYFSLGIVNIIMLFQPEMIVLSGGVMRSYDLFQPAVERTLAVVSGGVPANSVRIVPAQLGYHAGIVGAAYAILPKI